MTPSSPRTRCQLSLALPGHRAICWTLTSPLVMLSPRRPHAEDFSVDSSFSQ